LNVIEVNFSYVN